MIAEVERCAAVLAGARELAEEAFSLLAVALEGAVGLEWESALALSAISDVVDGIEGELLPGLAGVVARLEAVRERLVGEGGAAGADLPLLPFGGEPLAVPAEEVERLRGELPPPVVRGTGQKTHGRWIGPDGRVRAIVSGRDADAALVHAQLAAKGMPDESSRNTDVEQKLAAHMVASGIRHVTVVINHRPCRGFDDSCDTLVPIILPEGCTLTVHGQTDKGTRTRVRYTGGARPWWS
ncbi:DddA-like double-stranded DNA deaminase toxin [Actinosynnema pretiosum]|uniref:DddA-like double-stranded DNA deaminase toxin n=1 Tax=Actinosynnema pretiosum TaxID=42197 RepID=UPI0020A3A4AB|nr:DddA-like double-stranded DNA deaminase toxin [Actinosynnema pretiosum]